MLTNLFVKSAGTETLLIQTVLVSGEGLIGYLIFGQDGPFILAS